MTYYNRRFQAEKTLKSIQRTKCKNYKVIIVDDASDKPFGTISIKKEDKFWTNPVIAYNIGIIEALKHNPDIIILQNAECYHRGDVLRYAEDNLTDSNYISFPCFSLDKENTFNGCDIEKVIKDNNVCATANGQNAWYNHPIYRPTGYDFCSAIKTKNLVRLNGYDERFAEGVAWGDEDLIRRVKMFLTVEIPESPMVVHQWHYNGKSPYDDKEAYERNKSLFFSLNGNIKAEHLYTKELCEQN